MKIDILCKSQIRIKELRNIVSTVLLIRMIIQRRKAIKRYRFQQVHINAVSFYNSRFSEEFNAIKLS